MIGKAFSLSLAFALVLLANAEDLFAHVKSGEPKTVKISDGQLKGYVADGVASFLGIPYAAPPVGDLRWKPPAPPQKWSGMRDAGAFGPACVQENTLGVFAVPSMSEDCLYLNVFTPVRNQHRLRPVMFWIHGGALVDGRSNDYNMRKLVRDGDIVGVSIGYRLNIFGFMSHPAIDKEGHPFGQYGTLDQQAAMKWVQANIKAFGGDPNNVTLFGQSAGGTAITFNLVSPAAEGLFRKVILQSGVVAAAQTPRNVAEENGSDFAIAIGCKDQSPACMRSKSVREIVATASRFLNTAVRPIDGTVLPGQVQTLLAEGRFHKVPMLVGSTADEWTWFTGLTELADKKPMGAEDYKKSLTSIFGAQDAAKVETRYKLSNAMSPSEVFSNALTARGFFCPARRFIRSASKNGVPIYVYEFKDRNAPQYFPPVSYPYGAAHTLDLQYIFPGYHGAQGVTKPLSTDQQKLSDSMIKYWTNFAKTGNPNGAGVSNWPAWSVAQEHTQMLDAGKITTGTQFAAGRECDFWDTL